MPSYAIEHAISEARGNTKKSANFVEALGKTKVGWGPWQEPEGLKVSGGSDIHVGWAGNNSASQVLDHPILGSFTFIPVQLLPHNRAYYQETSAIWNNTEYIPTLVSSPILPAYLALVNF